MRKLKILHTSALLLDSPFEALDAPRAAECRAEQRELLEKIGGLFESEKANLMLLSGNLLSSACSSSRSGEELMAMLGSLKAPVFISPGKEDYYSPTCPYARLRLPDNVHVFTENKLQSLLLPELGVRVYGAAAISPACPALAEDFSARPEEGILSLLCLCAQYSEDGRGFNPISEAELARSGLDFAALGFDHRASGLKKAGSTFYSYSGSPLGRSFEETDEKTVSIIEYDDGQWSLRPVSLASRRYRLLNVDLDGSEPLIAIHSQLPDDTVSDIYRIVLTGESPRVPKLKELEEKLSGMFFALQLKDETRLCSSIWERAGEDSLRGLFLKKLLERMKNAENSEEQLAIERAARWGLAALDGEEEPVRHEN